MTTCHNPPDGATFIHSLPSGEESRKRLKSRLSPIKLDKTGAQNATTLLKLQKARA